MDEDGLWVIYATEASTVNIVISKLNDTTLVVAEHGSLQCINHLLPNTFMVCGVLSPLRTLNTRIERNFLLL